jgi:hypothetical protein
MLTARKALPLRTLATQHRTREPQAPWIRNRPLHPSQNRHRQQRTTALRQSAIKSLASMTNKLKEASTSSLRRHQQRPTCTSPEACQHVRAKQHPHQCQCSHTHCSQKSSWTGSICIQSNNRSQYHNSIHQDGRKPKLYCSILTTGTKESIRSSAKAQSRQVARSQAEGASYSLEDGNIKLVAKPPNHDPLSL